MKKLLTILGIVTLAASAAADEGATTVDELRSMCKAQLVVQNTAPLPRTGEDMVIQKGAAACTFYIAGVINLVLLPGVADSLRVCIPKGTTMDQLRFNVEGLMREVPNELREYNAAFAIVAALRTKYPCQGKATNQPR